MMHKNHRRDGAAPQHIQLFNGLRVVALPDGELPLVASAVVYEVGSSDDPEGCCGLAHLAEHLALTGSLQGRLSFPERVEQRGGRSNAATSYNTTSYTQLLPRKELPLALEIEAQRMAEPVGGDLSERLEVERRVLIQERRQKVETQPYARAIEQLHGLLFCPRHPYHRPTIGRPSDLQAITEDKVRAFFRHHYGPGKAVLVLAGDLPEDWAHWVEQILGRVAPTDRANPADHSLTDHSPTDQSGPRSKSSDKPRQRVTDSVPYTRIYMGLKTGGFGTHQATAATLAAGVLAIGPDSPLQRHLIRDEGLAREVTATVSVLRDATSLVFSAAAVPGVTADDLEQALVEQVHCGLTRLPISGLIEARRQALLDHYYRLQRLRLRSESAARWMLWQGIARDPWKAENYSDLDDETLLSWGVRLSHGGEEAVLTIAPQKGGRACA